MIRLPEVKAEVLDFIFLVSNESTHKRTHTHATQEGFRFSEGTFFFGRMENLPPLARNSITSLNGMVLHEGQSMVAKVINVFF